MFLFIASFIIFTFANTFFHNIKISILTFILCFIVFIWFLILKYKNKFFNHTKYFLILVWSFVFSLLAIVIKDYNYGHDLAIDFINPPVLRTTPPFPKEDISYLIWTWEITDTYSYWKYIFQNEAWDTYILNSKKTYRIWDRLRLVWYLKDVNLHQTKTFSWIWEWTFDYDKRLIMKGYRGNIYEWNSILLDKNWLTSINFDKNNMFQLQTSPKSSEWDLNFISNIKRSLQSQIISIYWEWRNAWLILWMLIGDKSYIPKSEYQRFIDSGLVHLIAVSGWNIIMLTIFLAFILFFLPFYVRNIVILFSIVLYAFVCGMDSSVIRAVVFGWLGMMALFVGRETNFWRSVYIAFIIMLLINPYMLLYDLWFLLSFGAVMGIQIFNKKNKKILDSSLNSEWQTRLKRLIYKIYNGYIKPSIWANIGIFPIIIFFMWEINLIGFITNLFVLPIVPFVMIYGFISIFLYSLFPREGLLYIQKILINYIYKVSEIGSDYGIYLLVQDYKIKYLILIFFLIWLIIHMIKNKIIFKGETKEKNYNIDYKL